MLTVRQIELTDEECERDLRTVADDLKLLKALLELRTTADTWDGNR